MRRLLEVAIGVAVLVLVTARPALGQEELPPCDAGATETDAVPAALSVAQGERTKLSLERSREQRSMRIDLVASNCRFAAADIGSEVKALIDVPRDGSDRELEPGEKVFVLGNVVDAERVSLRVSVDPTQRTRPGSYTGDVVISDSRVAEMRVPITVTMQYANYALLLITIGLPTILFGTLLVHWKAKKAGATDPYRMWWTKVGNWIGVFGGLAAARTAWAKGYLEVEDFGADLVDTHFLFWPIMSGAWLGLAVLIATGFVGALTATTLLGDQARGSADAAVKPK